MAEPCFQHEVGAAACAAGRDEITQHMLLPLTPGLRRAGSNPLPGHGEAMLRMDRGEGTSRHLAIGKLCP
jgi:hypothetical protein